jgi:hypothetical protein
VSGRYVISSSPLTTTTNQTGGVGIPPSSNQHSDDDKTELSNQKLEIDSFDVNALGIETVKPSLKSEINELSLLFCCDNSHNIRSKRENF